MESNEPLLDAKGIADRLGFNVSYVYAMKRRGFKMVARRARFSAAFRWLEIHGSPRSGELRKKTEGSEQSRK